MEGLKINTALLMKSRRFHNAKEILWKDFLTKVESFEAIVKSKAKNQHLYFWQWR